MQWRKNAGNWYKRRDATKNRLVNVRISGLLHCVYDNGLLRRKWHVRGELMNKVLISLEESQVQVIEQIVLDEDGAAAIKFLEELSRIIKLKKIGCNPLEFRARGHIDDVIDRANK
jgi:hypothetical protein